MTPLELKASILQLAIQGKLVEQRPEEGTGAELLEKILATSASAKASADKKNTKGTKKNSHAESRSRGERSAFAVSSSPGCPVSPGSPVPPADAPFDIPESWVWVRLGEVGSWGSGATPSRTHAEYFGGSVPWLKTGDLNDGYVSSIPETITDLALEETSVRLNPIGSVLMAMYGATIGKLGILQIAATTNQACCACIPYDGVWNKYLLYYLMARRKAFIKMGEGGAQPNISKEKIVNALIPLPPLAEQKRIVSKIEDLLPYIDRYEKAWSKLEDFNKRFPGDMQKSLLQMAIQGKLVEQRPEEGTGEELYRQIQSEKQRLIKSGKIKKEKPLPEITPDEIPFDIPESWMWVRLGEICKSIADGDHQPPPQVPSGIPFLVISNVSKGTLDFSNTRFVPMAYFNSLSGERIPGRGDILFTVTGSYGIPLKIDINRSFCFQRHMALLKLLTNREYLFYALMSPVVQKQCDNAATGTAQKTVGLNALRNLLIPLPPLAEQKRIVAKLEELLPLCERLK